MLAPLVSILPLIIFRKALSEWPDQQLAVVRGMLRSPAAVTSALRMARDEMASVKALEAPLLKKHSEKIYLYCASKDDWVGKEKEGVIAALGGPSERIVEDIDDTPHAFVITESTLLCKAVDCGSRCSSGRLRYKGHSHRVAKQCSLWLQGRNLVKKEVSLS